MADYQLFLFGADGRTWRQVVLPCEDDAEAVRIAAEHSGRRVIELWRGDRFIQRFPKQARPN